MAAAPIANGPGRVGALMEEVDSGGSALATTEEAVELIPLHQYVSLGYPGLGMIEMIRPAREYKEVAEWRPSPGRKNDLIMLSEKDQLVSADEEKIKIVGKMTNVAFRLGKVHALGHVVVLDVNTYDVLFGLPALVALRANLDFERRSIVVRNTGGKPYAVPMRLTLRTTINAVPQVSPMMAGTLRMISSDESADGKSSTNDADNSDEDDPEIPKLARQCVYYPPPITIVRKMHLTNRNVQRTKAMILGEPLVQIWRMVDSLEPPQTLYEGITPLLSRYIDKKHYCDIADLPRSLLTPAKEVRLLRLGAKASSLEPPGRLEAETDQLGVKIATKSVPWQEICDGITPEGHVAIREEDAQMMATVFSWRSDHSFISASPPDVKKPAHTKKTDVRIWDQLFELHVPQYIPDEIHQVIADILTEYRGAISVTDTDIGLSLVIQHEIQMGNHSPIHCKPYRYSLIERKKALERIQEFETCGWIKPATRPWSFPIVLVPKKNRAIRICIDYRKQNEITIKSVYPLPRIDDFLDAIGCANYFSKFDIRHGFHHILVKEEDRPKMAFVLFEGTWQWARCTMGICNAPATLQRAMNMTFQNFVNKTRLTQGMINFCVIVYMDDILVYSETYHEHAQHIEWTLGALIDAGFKIALEKSEFSLSEISFLGHVVTRGGLQSDSRKVAAVREARVPTSLMQVRAFLGLASYYRRFTKGFAAIALPLTNLLREDHSLSWDAELARKRQRMTELAQGRQVRSYEARNGNEGPRPQYKLGDIVQVKKCARQEQGDLLGIVFGKVEEGNLALITDELQVFLTQLVDDLPLDILSHSDKQPGTHVLSRTLEPHLVWSTCMEIDEDNCLYPSQALYLDIDVTDLTFWDPIARQNVAQDEEIGGADEEEEEEEPSSEERDDPDYVPESEAGIADESSQPRDENEEEEEVEPDEEEEEGNKQAESE
ncbi:hypothetical protein CBR_g26365 [Chara braunii]|uniref:Reverse transcriptase domain-containing protein n=1 Tax=Chara braunii TaxID=69332 RepID=A0A388L7Q7_CHABU|nr:hypothetical protein CBR_g26365 [Chara braunii]|eukprot:GBG78336.1 hypothetical protein CBR_g26365 [Chara braunii]